MIKGGEARGIEEVLLIIACQVLGKDEKVRYKFE